ncbi:MAG: hypothetical protein HY865_12355 [Chloroflexi bacterium]|nr:hypothetical protein [Chloroflexota bacterium]
MKLLQFLFQAGASLLIAFIASFSSAVIFFNYSGYENRSDRIFLVAIPTLAIAFLLYETFTRLWTWFTQRQPVILIAFGALAAFAAVEFGLPSAVSRVYYLGMAALAFVLFAFMLPAAPVVERLRPAHSMGHYFLGFLLSLFPTYGVIAFLSGVFEDRFGVIVFTLTFTIVGSVVGYYLVRRASQSLRDGFLSNPVNLILVLSLPLFLAGIILGALQYPAMFSLAYIQMPGRWFGMWIASAVVGGAWGLLALEQVELRGYARSFQQTKLFAFIKDNLPGIYAGSLFFLINLIIARALNHPTYSINSLIFEADAGPWMSILGYPEGHDVNRAVHPLVLLTLRPLTSLVRLFVADKWFFAPMIVVAAMNGLAVLLAWLFAKRAAKNDAYAFAFALILGSTAAHLLFGSLTETYVFGMISLILFAVLVQADEKRFAALVPAGLLVFGVTVTNIAQSMILLFFKKTFSFWRLVYYGVIVLTISIALTALVSVLYPGNQTFFFVPADLAFEGRFSKPIYEGPMERIVERVGVVGRTIFLYGAVAPTPMESLAHKNTSPITEFETFNYRSHEMAWYNEAAYVPLVLWLVLLTGAFFYFFKNLRSSPHTPLMVGLLACVAFNYLLHMNYGTELFLYSTYWTYLLVFFVALAFSELAGRRWFEVVLAAFALMLMLNNGWFILVILRGLDPYLSAV